MLSRLSGFFVVNNTRISTGGGGGWGAQEKARQASSSPHCPLPTPRYVTRVALDAPHEAKHVPRARARGHCTYRVRGTAAAAAARVPCRSSCCCCYMYAAASTARQARRLSGCKKTRVMILGAHAPVYNPAKAERASQQRLCMRPHAMGKAICHEMACEAAAGWYPLGQGEATRISITVLYGRSGSEV